VIAWRDTTPTGFLALGRGGLRVQPLSFGGAPLGNLGTAISDEAAAGAVYAAWERGIRYFDVSPHYGLGLAERRLGSALREYPRDEYILSTKVGRVLFDTGEETRHDTQGFDVRSNLRRVFDYSADGVRRSLEESLSRLGLDRIDIVYVHDPENHYPEAIAGAFPALDELRHEGTIVSYGAGMNESEMLAEVVRETDSDIVLAARTWTLSNQAALDDLMPIALDRGVSVVVGGVFYQLPLSGDTGIVGEVCRQFNVSIVSAATRFPYTHPAVTTTLVGMRSAEETAIDVDSFSASLPEGFWPALRQALGIA
jgi:D-threo-aldose 1-dehydrogenase